MNKYNPNGFYKAGQVVEYKGKLYSYKKPTGAPPSSSNSVMVGDAPKPVVKAPEKMQIDVRLPSDGKNGRDGKDGLSIRGPKGDKGDKGDRGEIGLKGEKGDKGDTGAKGDKGDKGDAGRDGINGVDGISGIGLEYDWDGTKLGVKRENEVTYRYVDLKGKDGANGLGGGGRMRAQDLNKLLTAGSNITLTQTGNTLTVASTGGGAGDFIDLVDVPSTYTGQASKFVKVKATEDGLEFVAGSGSAVAWGDITGTLSNQTDLQTALDGKVDENAAITGATKTKVTYDAKGLVTAGADATTADIADSTDKRYVTDAQLTVIGNTSGTNTGDQNLSGLVPYTGATANVDLGTYDLITDTITSKSSAGLIIEANGGGDVLHIGNGGGVNATAYGGWNFDGATANTIASFGASKTLSSLATATYPDLTELSYVKGVTSALQTQLNGKQPLATVLTNTTASFTTALETKLNGIEAGADVTDATNVAAAGAVMTSSLGTGVAASLAVNLGAANTIATVNAGGTALNYLYAINQNIQTVDSPTFAGVTLSAAALPSTNDAAALGSASLSWSDLFLASGGVINWNNGGVTLAEASGSLQLDKNFDIRQTEDTVWNESFSTGVYSGIRIRNDSTTVGSASGITFWNRTTSVATGGIMQVLAGANDADTYYSVEGGSHNFCGITPSTATTVAVNGDLTVTDEAYGSGWNASTEVPTKNAVYDKIESMNVTSGTYTPTLTNTTNVAASTAYTCQYMRVGDVVTVSGRVAIDPTATGNTELRVSLPIASNLTSAEQCAGTFSMVSALSSGTGGISGNTGSDVAVFNYLATDIANRSFYFSFTYLIL